MRVYGLVNYAGKSGIDRWHLTSDGIKTLCGLKRTHDYRAKFGWCDIAWCSNATTHPFLFEQGCGRCRRSVGHWSS